MCAVHIHTGRRTMDAQQSSTMSASPRSIRARLDDVQPSSDGAQTTLTTDGYVGSRITPTGDASSMRKGDEMEVRPEYVLPDSVDTATLGSRETRKGSVRRVRETPRLTPTWHG